MRSDDIGLYVLFGAYLLLFLAGIVTFSLSRYHFGKAVSHAKQPYFAALFGMFAPFMSTLYDEAGNRHRLLFFRYQLITLPIWGILLLGQLLISR